MENAELKSLVLVVLSSSGEQFLTTWNTSSFTYLYTVWILWYLPMIHTHYLVFAMYTVPLVHHRSILECSCDCLVWKGPSRLWSQHCSNSIFVQLFMIRGSISVPNRHVHWWSERNAVSVEPTITHQIVEKCLQSRDGEKWNWLESISILLTQFYFRETETILHTLQQFYFFCFYLFMSYFHYIFTRINRTNTIRRHMSSLCFIYCSSLSDLSIPNRAFTLRMTSGTFSRSARFFRSTE